MNLKSSLKQILSGILSITILSTFLLNFPVKADDIIEKYPYTMFAASEEEGAITINTLNVCINGNIATNGTISFTADNFNVNGTKTENADEAMIYCFKKLDYAYFKGNDVETYSEDYIYEDMNINISNPIETEGKMELTGNINLSTGIKAFENIELNGEVENTNDSVIFSENGDIVINTTNLNLNGLVYAPEGCIDITAQNLNMNNVIIIADTIRVECPSLNANNNNLMAEFIGTDSELDLEIYAFGNYISKANAIEIFWNTTVTRGTFDVQMSDDNCIYNSIGTVNDADSFNFIISEDFDKKYIKVVETTYYGEISESIPFIVVKSDYGYTIDFLDSDSDGLNDIFELEIGTDINNPDSDEDGLTDYQEVYLTGTDPTKYDSVIEGLCDADVDSDEDGLANIYEIENGTDPLSKDTDNDGLTDYEEIFIYNTNPVIPDTDGDGLEDGDEPHISLDPINPETFGFPDIEYSIQQQITADSELFSEINIEENPYELSIDLKTNGYAEKNLYVSQSGYSAVIDNEAMLGFSTDIEMDDIYNPANIVLKYKIKDIYLNNTLGIYSDYEEFNGIKRLNVFKFDEDTNMLLPIETKFDIENNLIYAEVDELGTYCIMDIEIWLNNLGVEVLEESASEENFILKKSPKQSASSWTPEYINAPIDLVFLIDSSGGYKNEFEHGKNLIENFCKYVFDNYDNIRVHIIASTSYSSDIINSSNGINWLTNYNEVKTALNSINYIYDNSEFESSNRFNKILNDVTLRDDSDIFIYTLYNHGYFQNSSSNLSSLAFCKMNIGIYSEILPKNWHYKDLNYEKDVESAISANNGLFIELDENTLYSLINNFNENLSPLRPVYEIIVPTNWKKIALNGELSPTNGIDTDGDSLTDWEEVDISRLKWNDDGSFEIPTLSVIDIVSTISRYQDAKYNYLFEKAPKQRFLPIISDPTMQDSDKDGILDPDEYTNLTTDSRYDNINPLKADTLETLYPELTQNSKTNVDTNPIYLDIRKNTIYIDVKYKLNDKAYELSDIIKPGSTDCYTNEDIVIKSISDKWNTEIQGNLFDFYPGMSIKVEINLIEALFNQKCIKFKINDKDKNVTSTKFGADWTTKNIKYIELSTKDGEGKYLPESNRFAAPAHELGHALGLGDLYGYTSKEYSHRRLQPLIYDISKTTENELWYKDDGKNPDGDLMFSFGLVRPNDIEMILEAYCENQKQYFKPEIGKNINSSKVIKQKRDNVYLDRINKKFVIYDIESETITSIGNAYAYQTYLKDNYGVNITVTQLEEVYGKNNITS